MSALSDVVSRRTILGAVAAVAVAMALVVVVTTLHHEPDRPTGSFCLSFDRTNVYVAEARRALAGTPRPGDPTLETQRASAPITWSATSAAGAPDHLEGAARRVARAMRSALLDRHLEAVDRASFRRDVRRLAREAPAACEGRPD